MNIISGGSIYILGGCTVTNGLSGGLFFGSDVYPSSLVIAGGAFQGRDSALMSVFGDLVLYNPNPNPNAPLSAKSGLWNAVLDVSGAVTIGQRMGWNMWASEWNSLVSLNTQWLSIAAGGQLFFGCDGAGCAVGSTSIMAGGGQELVSCIGSIVVALPSIDHTVYFDPIIIDTQNGNSGLLNVSSGAVDVRRGIFAIASPTAPVPTSVLVYDALEPFGARNRSLATLHSGRSITLSGGAELRVIGVAGGGSVNSTASPFPVVTGMGLTTDNSSTIRIDLNPTQGIAIPGVKISVERFSGPVAVTTGISQGRIVITGSTDPAFYRPLASRSLPQTIVPIQWETDFSPATPNSPLSVQLASFPQNTETGVNVNPCVTPTGLILLLSYGAPSGPLSCVPVPPTPGGEDGPDGLRPGVVAAIVICVIVFVGGAGFLLYRYRKRRESQTSSDALYMRGTGDAQSQNTVPFNNF